MSQGGRFPIDAVTVLSTDAVHVSDRSATGVTPGRTSPHVTCWPWNFFTDVENCPLTLVRAQLDRGGILPDNPLLRELVTWALAGAVRLLERFKSVVRRLRTGPPTKKEKKRNILG